MHISYTLLLHIALTHCTYTLHGTFLQSTVCLRASGRDAVLLKAIAKVEVLHIKYNTT